MDLHATEVDGVPAVWSDVAGPLRAGLLFRVGEADERLVEHGVSHLVEHAAIRAVDAQDSFAGSVDLLETSFEVWGGEDRVVTGLSALCSALRDLPRDGLDVERRILATESANAGTALPHLLLHGRYGARGVGLAMLDELGLRALDDDAVLRWASERFVRGNAALWLTGPPPPGLRLDLQDGARQPTPEPQPLDGLALPARMDGPPGVVAMGAPARSGPDDALAGLVAAALERRAKHRLRTTLGLSYAVDGRALRISDTQGLVVLSADCQEEHATAVCEELLTAWDDVADGGAIEDGREHQLHVGPLAFAEPDGQRVVLTRSAGRLLRGQELLTPAEALDRLAAADAGEVAALARTLSRELIAAMPEGTAARPGLAEHVPSTGEPVTGRRFARRRAPHHVDAPRAIVVGHDGVTAEGDGLSVTIRFGDVVAAIERIAGALDLLSAQGMLMSVDPGDIRDGDDAVAAVRDAVAPDLVVPLDPRAARLEAAAAEQFDRRWVVAPALEHAWPVLAWDEEVRVLAEGSKGVHGGVLVVTDRQVLLATKVLEGRVERWPRSAIRAATGRDVAVAARLRLDLADGSHVSIWIGPRGRLKRVLAELQAERAQQT